VAANLTHVSADSPSFYAARVRLGLEQVKLLGVNKVKAAGKLRYSR